MKRTYGWFLALAALAGAASPQSRSWDADASLMVPPRTPGAVADIQRAMPKRDVEKNADALKRAARQISEGAKVAGPAVFVLDGGDTAYAGPQVVFNSTRAHESVEVFHAGVGVAYTTGSTFCRVYARDPRSRFRLLGDQIALQQKPLGKLIKEWKDANGAQWSEFQDERPNQTPNTAKIRWGDKAKTWVAEADSYLGDCAEKCFLFSKLTWKGGQPFEHMVHSKFHPAGHEVSRLTLTNWRSGQATFESVLARIPPTVQATDARLGESAPLVYAWKGKLPTLSDLKAMRESGRATVHGQAPTLPAYAWIGSAGVVVLGAGVLWRLRHRRPKEIRPSLS